MAAGIAERLPTRRMVLGGLAAGVAAYALPSSRAGAAGEITSTPVAPGFTLLGGAGGNILAVGTSAGLVLVDTGAAGHATAVRAAVEGLGGGAVVKVFNTHWHGDQIGCNEAFGAAGATLVAHEKTRLRLTTGYYLPAEDRYEPALPAAGRPTETLYTEATTTVGATRIEYGYLIEAHTDGDIFVAFPDANVVAVGDVVSPARDPVLDWYGGGWLGGRVDALALLLARSDDSTRFVPSYGPAIGRAQVVAEHKVMLELFDRMVVHVRLGESARDMLAAGVLDGLGRTFDDPYAFLYSVHKGFWAHHNKLTHDIV